MLRKSSMLLIVSAGVGNAQTFAAGERPTTNKAAFEATTSRSGMSSGSWDRSSFQAKALPS
jgi:hypothetical protein